MTPRWYDIHINRPRDGDEIYNWDRRNRFWTLVLFHLIGVKRKHYIPPSHITYEEIKVFCGEKRYKDILREIYDLGMEDMIVII